MTGTRKGGLQARDKNLARDPLHYAKIGSKGGSNGHTGGFHGNPELARTAGAKGGAASSRRGVRTTRTCKACLIKSRTVLNGLCTKCQSIDTPSLRALLNIDKRGKPCKANSVNTSSTTNAPRTEVHLPRSPGFSKNAAELSGSGRSRMHLPLVSNIVDRVKVRYFEAVMDRLIDAAAKDGISSFGSKPSKGA